MGKVLAPNATVGFLPSATSHQKPLLEPRRIASIARGHHGLKSAMECLCHVNLLHLYLGGPYATSLTLGAPLRPKKQAKIHPTLVLKNFKGLAKFIV